MPPTSNITKRKMHAFSALERVREDHFTPLLYHISDLLPRPFFCCIPNIPTRTKYLVREICRVNIEPDCSLPG